MAVPVSATSGLGSADILWKVAIEICRMMRYSNTKVDDDDNSSHLRGEKKVCLFACGKGARVETSWASIMNVSATVRSFVSSSPHDYAVWVYLAKDSTRNTSSLGCKQRQSVGEKSSVGPRCETSPIKRSTELKIMHSRPEYFFVDTPRDFLPITDPKS